VFKIKRIIVGIMILLVLILGISLYKHLTHAEKKTGFLNILPLNVDLALKKIHFIQADREHKEWELYADQAEYTKDKEETLLTDIMLKIFLKNDSILKLSADKGLFYNTKKDFTIWGNIIMEDERGNQLKTAKMEYIKKEKKMFANQKIIFSSPPLYRITGERMIYNIDLETITISGNVKCHFKIKNQQLSL